MNPGLILYKCHRLILSSLRSLTTRPFVVKGFSRPFRPLKKIPITLQFFLRISTTQKKPSEKTGWFHMFHPRSFLDGRYEIGSMYLIQVSVWFSSLYICLGAPTKMAWFMGNHREPWWLPHQRMIVVWFISWGELWEDWFIIRGPKWPWNGGWWLPHHRCSARFHSNEDNWFLLGGVVFHPETNILKNIRKIYGFLGGWGGSMRSSHCFGGSTKKLRMSEKNAGFSKWFRKVLC